MKAIALSLYTLFIGALAHAQVMPTTATSATTNGTPLAAPVYSSPVVNSIRTWQLQKPITDAALIGTSIGITDAQQQIQYMDGLGRPVQTVSKGVTPLGKDMVAPVYYDGYGRASLQYLPYAATAGDGSFKVNPFQDQASFMQQQYGSQGEQFFYGQTLFDNSPLDRPVKSMAAGNSWSGSGRGVEVAYDINVANEVRNWTIGLMPGSSPVFNGYYDAGELLRTITKDEHDKRVVEYKDKAGQVLLKKVEIGPNAVLNTPDGWLSTYYVYDDMYRLRFVFSPKATSAIEGSASVADVADGLCFRYEYDQRGRLVLKKVPDAAEVYMIYDARDRLVFMQDGNMRPKHQWLTTLYDDENRPILTGMTTYTGTRSDLTTYAADPQHLGRYSITVQAGSPLAADLILPVRQPGEALYQASSTIDFVPDFFSEPDASFLAEIVAPVNQSATIQVVGNPLPAGATLIALTQSFYDDYSFTQKTYDNSNNSKLIAGSEPYPDAVPSAVSNATRGLATGGKVWVMKDPADLTVGKWLEMVTYFDEWGRTVQAQADNEKGGVDKSTSRYSFSGKVVSTYQTHENPHSETGAVRVLTSMNYDAMGRLLTVSKKINDAGAATVISANEYDELGQLKNKNLGAGLQSLAYEYNIRGWMSGINKAYVETGSGGRFGQELSYDYGFSGKQFNGNIAGTKWRTVGDGTERAYGFSYDDANRLMAANYNELGGTWNHTDADYSIKMGDGVASSTAYDENGNILRMQQWGGLLSGSIQMDDLNYKYIPNSNRLLNVVDYMPDPAIALGDFRVSAQHLQKSVKDLEVANPASQNLAQLVDYKYDVNGNMVQDRNKNITTHTDGDGIVYNHLNLPALIHIKKDANTDKGTIQYVYDAGGNKLQKIVVEDNVTITQGGSSYVTRVETTTDYVGQFIYETKYYSNSLVSGGYANKLQFFADEEGRIRPTDNTAKPFAFDYFIKDHLGNVRMVLTDEQKVDKYPVASLEDSKLSTEGNYYQIAQGQVVPASQINGLPSYTNDNGIGNVPGDATFEQASSQKLYQLNGSSVKTGLGITLKVMAGDKLDIFGKSYYNQSNVDGLPANTPIPISEIVTGLVGGTGAVLATGHQSVGAGDLSGLPGVTSGLGTLFGNETDDIAQYEHTPKAYINYIIFDEHFKYKASGFSRVSVGAGLKDHHSDLSNINIPVNGFVYIYCSNQSPVNVFFDNLQVVHTRGPVLEETHYYPFGLTMAGISSKALSSLVNRNKFTGSEQQLAEFVDGSGLQLYDFSARAYSDQIGRFLNIDPEAASYQSLGPYVYVRNNPQLRIDPSGKWDVTVHVYNNRDKYGYGIAIVTDRHGREVYRFKVRVEGTGGRNRKVANSDTPLGVYDIPEKGTWLKGGSRLSYGPNFRLALNGESGEIKESGRSDIRIHGGRQENYDEATDTWTNAKGPKLKKTHGCMRAFDADIAKMKEITDDLEKNDSEEDPGKLKVVDDLVEKNGAYSLPQNSTEYSFSLIAWLEKAFESVLRWTGVKSQSYKEYLEENKLKQQPKTQ